MSRGTLLMIGSEDDAARMFRMVPLGERYARGQVSTRASSEVIVAPAPTPYFLIAFAASTVTWSSVASMLDAEVVVVDGQIEVGWISQSLMNCQMMRVISSPSSSTMVPLTLIVLAPQDVAR
jgi:hypothetical protein